MSKRASRRSVRKVAIGLILAVTLPANQIGAEEFVDGLVARLDRVVLLSSDLELARLAGLGGEEATEAEIAHRRVILEQQFLDLESSGELERLGIDRVEAGQRLRHRLPDQAAAFGGRAIDDLALRLAAVEVYVEERLARRIAVSRSELEQTWWDELGHLESPPAFDAVRDQLERLLVERKLNGEIAEWESTVAGRWPAWCPLCSKAILETPRP